MLSHDLKLSRASVSGGPDSTCELDDDSRAAELRSYLRESLECHPARAAFSGTLSDTRAFNCLARDRAARVGHARGQDTEDGADALGIFAHSVLMRARAEALGVRGTPARCLALLAKMALPGHGLLGGGGTAAQARAALSLTLLQPTHVWDVLDRMPEDQRVEFHVLVLHVARSLEAMWSHSHRAAAAGSAF